MKRNDFVKLTETHTTGYGETIQAGTIGRVIHVHHVRKQDAGLMSTVSCMVEVQFRNSFSTCKVPVAKLEVITNEKAGCIMPKVGDLFASSWGYDQTNVDFYKIVGLSKQFATLVRLPKIKTYSGPMEGVCVADTNDTAGEEFMKRIMFTTGGAACFRINSYEVAYLTNPTREHIFTEWA